MAIVDVHDASIRHGKMNKKDNAVYRTRNGKQHVYQIINKNTSNTRAQKSNRSHFGQVNTIVNSVMANPQQVEQWSARMEEANAQLLANRIPKKYNTVRQFVFAVISEQLKAELSKPKRRQMQPTALPRGIKLHIKHFAELTAADLYEILKARFAVFVMEQGVRYLDMDNIDYTAIHLFLRRRGQVIAYARIYKDEEEGIWNIGRLLTLQRGKGYGKFLMKQAVAEAKKQGAQVVRIHAQVQSKKFYRLLGFKVVGEEFMEADIPHICMQK